MAQTASAVAAAVERASVPDQAVRGRRVETVAASRAVEGDPVRRG